MGNKVIKSNKILYGVSGLIFVSGIIIFIIILITGINASVNRINTQVVVPGTEIVELKETGKYIMFFEYYSVIDGKVFETNNINGLMCSIKSIKSGEYIKLNNSSGNSNYSIPGRKGESIFDFVIDESGKYEIKGFYEKEKGEEAVLAIGKGFCMALFRTVSLSIAILFISIGVSGSILMYTLKKRKKAINNKIWG